MPTIELAHRIAAPRERVFDLARHVDCHEDSMAAHDERAVDGVTSGLLGEGDRVTWRARHFWIPFRLTSEITDFDRPVRFRDEQVSGPFARLVHEHRFEPVEPTTSDRAAGAAATDGPVTLATERFTFASPLGPLGSVVDRLVLARYLRDVLETRAAFVERVAESDEWRRYLEG